MSSNNINFKAKNGLDVGLTANIGASLNVAQNASIGGTVTAAGFSGPLTGNVTGNASGTAAKWAAAMTLATSGDATGSGTFDGNAATTIALTLKNTGSVGTYTKVTTDAQGRVTTGSALGASDVTGALTFTPVNKAGDTMSGTLVNATGFNGPLTGNVTGNASGTAAKWAAAMTLAHSGDATGSGTFDGSIATTIALTLATQGGLTGGTYNNLTVNTKGLVTSASNISYLTGNQSVTVSGDATGSGATAISLTLASVNGSIGTWNNVTVNSKGLVTNGSNIAYLTTVTNGNVTTALGFTPVAAVNTSIYAALGFTPVNIASLGVANGVATLDGSGKLTTAQIPAGLVGAVDYQGTWNANTNTPSLNPALAGVATAGQYWLVATSGTTSMTGVLGTLNSWTAGDIIISDGPGIGWGKIDGNPTEVLSVNGMTGAVTVSTISGNAGTASQWAAAMTLNIGGDVSGSTSFSGASTTTFSLTLGTSGATAGTYNTLTINNKGIVTGASNTGYITALNTTSIYSALGFTPVAAVPTSIYSALGYTPYNQSNPTGYITSLNTSSIYSALGYTPANIAGTTFTGSVLFNNGITISGAGGETLSGALNLSYAQIYSGSVTGVGITSTTIDTFATLTVRSAKYMISVDGSSSSGGFETTEIMVTQDSVGNTYISEYGQVYTGSAPIAAITATIVSGSVNVQLAAVSGTVNVKFARTTIAV